MKPPFDAEVAEKFLNGVSIHIKGNENMMTKAQKFVDLEIHQS